MANTQEKCEVLNVAYCKVFTDDDGNFPIMNQVSTVLPSLTITTHAIELAIKRVKNSSAVGPDNIPIGLIKSIVDILSPILQILYTRTLNENMVPAVWKLSKVTPIFKKGSKSEPKNYRPVSITVHLCKIFERLLNDHIVCYLESNFLMEICQHGFRKKLSTETNLLTFYDEVTELIENRLPVDVIYYDQCF